MQQAHINMILISTASTTCLHVPTTLPCAAASLPYASQQPSRVLLHHCPMQANSPPMCCITALCKPTALPCAASLPCASSRPARSLLSRIERILCPWNAHVNVVTSMTLYRMHLHIIACMLAVDDVTRECKHQGCTLSGVAELSAYCGLQVWISNPDGWRRVKALQSFCRRRQNCSPVAPRLAKSCIPASNPRLVKEDWSEALLAV